MFRLILVALVLLGVALYLPDSRAAIYEKAAPALDPVFEWSTKGEMNKIAREMELHERQHRSVPDRQQEFADWMSQKFGTDPGALTDSWGRPYRWQAWPDSFAVISAGRDRTNYTEDDLRTARPREYSARRR